MHKTNILSGKILKYTNHVDYHSPCVKDNKIKILHWNTHLGFVTWMWDHLWRIISIILNNFPHILIYRLNISHNDCISCKTQAKCVYIFIFRKGTWCMERYNLILLSSCKSVWHPLLHGSTYVIMWLINEKLSYFYATLCYSMSMLKLCAKVI